MTTNRLVPGEPASIHDTPSPSPQQQGFVGTAPGPVREGDDGDEEVANLAKFGFPCGTLHPKYDRK